jgi:DHA1 family bicyclomycin/chloramphenicol resistance-like MFS transporter
MTRPLSARELAAAKSNKLNKPDAALRAPLWLLALVVFSATFAMHIFVPALPHAANELHAGIPAMQLTISLYILGLAVGQLVYGPIADRFGRRSTLIGGLLLYTVAGLAAALVPNVHALIAARLFQAFGGCAGMVIGRAIVRDTAPPNETARRLALMNLMVTVGPALAPLAGGALAVFVSWRSIFVLLAILGLANLLFVWLLLSETGGKGLSSNFSTLAKHYRHLVASPAFVGYAIGGGCATTSSYAFVATAPFIFVNDLGRPVHEVGLYIAGLITGIWIGSLLTSRLISKISAKRLLIGSNLVSIAGAAVFLAAVLTHMLSVPLVMISMFVFTLGVGIAAPVALAQAVSVNPHVIGSASGLYGFAQMAVGALCTALAGIGGHPALATGIVLMGAGIIAQISFAVAVRWHPKQPTAKDVGKADPVV